MTLRAYLTIAAVVVLVVVGWWLRGLYEDRKDLAALEAREQEREAFITRESNIAKKVEDKLAELKANERIIEREINNVVERPVYRTSCLDGDGLQILKRIARGGDAAEPSGDVPGKPAGADRPDGR